MAVDGRILELAYQRWAAKNPGKTREDWNKLPIDERQRLVDELLKALAEKKSKSPKKGKDKASSPGRSR